MNFFFFKFCSEKRSTGFLSSAFSETYLIDYEIQVYSSVTERESTASNEKISLYSSTSSNFFI